MDNLEFAVEIYHSRYSMDDEMYEPFNAICNYEELQKVMEFALMRGYYVVVSLREEEEETK